MKLDTRDHVLQYLVDTRLVTSPKTVQIENLSGGVSSSVWKVMQGERRWVIKQALEKLKVSADWFADVERIHREHEVMEMLSPLVSPGVIPRVLHTDYVHHIYLMECAAEGSENWKDMLMAQHFSISVASHAGRLMREIHQLSNSLAEEDKRKLKDQKYFVQLRVDPFHFYLMKKYPEHAASIQRLVNEVTLRPTCLVHGDFSPKNILVENDEQIVLIDFEVAHWGNPVFDLAYCLGHLMLKAWHLDKRQEIMRLIESFLVAYGPTPDNLTPHLGLMLLARLDGKSPVNYLKDEGMKSMIRAVAFHWISGSLAGVGTVADIGRAFNDLHEE